MPCITTSREAAPLVSMAYATSSVEIDPLLAAFAASTRSRGQQARLARGSLKDHQRALQARQLQQLQQLEQRMAADRARGFWQRLVQIAKTVCAAAVGVSTAGTGTVGVLAAGLSLGAAATRLSAPEDGAANWLGGAANALLAYNVAVNPCAAHAFNTVNNAAGQARELLAIAGVAARGGLERRSAGARAALAHASATIEQRQRAAGEQRRRLSAALAASARDLQQVARAVERRAADAEAAVS